MTAYLHQGGDGIWRDIRDALSSIDAPTTAAELGIDDDDHRVTDDLSRDPRPVHHSRQRNERTGRSRRGGENGRHRLSGSSDGI